MSGVFSIVGAGLIDSVTSDQILGRLESSLSVFERTVVGGNVSVLNAAHTASSVSVRRFARLGSSASLHIE